MLWPDHCVQGTHGAQFSSEIELPHAEMVIRKGYHDVVDSYSGFREADRKTRTGLEGYLRERGFKRLFVAGLATDFCVNWTAVDAANAGFEHLCDRGCLPRHRHRRFAGQGLDDDERRRRQAPRRRGHCLEGIMRALAVGLMIAGMMATAACGRGTVARDRPPALVLERHVLASRRTPRCRRGRGSQPVRGMVRRSRRRAPT